MKTFILIFTLISLNSFAEDINWRDFKGEYDFVECQNNGHPVWGVHLKDRYVSITEDRRNPMVNDLKIDLFQKRPSPIVLRWDLENINQGIFLRRANSTREILSTQENFTNEQGLFSFMRWDHDLSSGWHNIELKIIDSETIQYSTTLYRSPSKLLQKETCLLTRI